MAWGWRMPFLLSAVVVAIGLVLRLKLRESPVFEEEVAKTQRARARADRRRPSATASARSS